MAGGPRDPGSPSWLLMVEDGITGMWSWIAKDSSKLSVKELIDAGRLPAPRSLLAGILLGLGLSVARLVLDAVVFKPLAARALGLKKIATPTPNSALNRACAAKKNRPLTNLELEAAARDAGVSVEDARSYTRMMRLAAQQEKQEYKFREALFRCLAYLLLTCAGYYVAHDQPWFQDPFSEAMWLSPSTSKADVHPNAIASGAWPNVIIPKIFWFYQAGLGLYWHFIVFQFIDTKRSDFWQMFIHHVVTLGLLITSWLGSWVQIGALIMLCHDVSDIFLEAAKLFNYLKKRHPWASYVADSVFFVFASVFMTTRLYLYPKYMLLNVIYTPYLSPRAHTFFGTLLGTLQVLHVFWFYLILRVIYNFLWHGVEEDVRSDDEGAGDDGHEQTDAGAPPCNGNGKAHASHRKKDD